MTVKKTVVQSPVVETKVEEVKAEQLLPKVGIGSTIVEMILKNPELSNKDILEEVLKKFANAKTTYACIAWYKSDLRKKNMIGPRVFTKKAKVEEVKV